MREANLMLCECMADPTNTKRKESESKREKQVKQPVSEIIKRAGMHNTGVEIKLGHLQGICLALALAEAAIVSIKIYILINNGYKHTNIRQSAMRPAEGARVSTKIICNTYKYIIDTNIYISEQADLKTMTGW